MLCLTRMPVLQAKLFSPKVDEASRKVLRGGYQHRRSLPLLSYLHRWTENAVYAALFGSNIAKLLL